jgi:YbbR domain-containing protein
VNARRVVRRLSRTIVHNWPLKLAAVILATLLYAGLVASQDSATYPGPIKVTPVDQPAGTVIVNLDQLRDVEQIRYIAPADLGRLRAEDFLATVNLSSVEPDGQPVNVRVSVTTVDPRVTILEFQPRSIQVVLDQLVSKTVPVVVDVSEPPDGLQLGDTTVTPSEVTVSGASTAVTRVTSARVSVTVDGAGLSIDRDLQPQPVDASGEIVSSVDVDPALVNVQVPVYENLSNRTVPVNPIVTGTPGAGFRVASVEVEPLVVSVEGDQDDLEALVSADTAPVMVSGATRDVTAQVVYALPNGLTVIGGQTATVTVRIEAVTETRTYLAGIRLDGRAAAFQYEASERQVLLTLFGSTAGLDRLDSSPIVISLNVADLEPGVHEVAVVPSLPSAITVAAISPEAITVTVTERPTPTPPPTPAPDPSASTEPSLPSEPTPAP